MVVIDTHLSGDPSNGCPTFHDLFLASRRRGR